MQSTKTMKFMPKPESSSFVGRRQLFKNIWDTAMNIDEKDDVINKSKVIKTLRLDEMNKLAIGKTKKQRFKNLRHVCNRILDYCDIHDADDALYEQMQLDEQAPPNDKMLSVEEDAKPPRKIKTHKRMRRVKQAKSLSVSAPEPTRESVKVTISDDFTRNAEAETSRISSPSKVNINSYVKSTDTKKKVKTRRKYVRAKSRGLIGDNNSRHAPTTPRRIVKRKLSKRKKSGNIFFGRTKTQ